MGSFPSKIKNFLNQDMDHETMSKNMKDPNQQNKKKEHSLKSSKEKERELSDEERAKTEPNELESEGGRQLELERQGKTDEYKGEGGEDKTEDKNTDEEEAEERRMLEGKVEADQEGMDHDHQPKKDEKLDRKNREQTDKGETERRALHIQEAHETQLWQCHVPVLAVAILVCVFTILMWGSYNVDGGTLDAAAAERAMLEETARQMKEQADHDRMIQEMVAWERKEMLQKWFTLGFVAVLVVGSFMLGVSTGTVISWYYRGRYRVFQNE